MLNGSDLSLKDLEYILAVSSYGSFTKAAEICAVSQPALSKQIKKLEDSLGLQLFERNSRQVLLTEKGLQFIQQAQRVMDQAQHLMDFSNQQRQPLSGGLRMGVIASVCPYLLPLFIVPLRQAYPLLKLAIKESLTDYLIADLKSGALDALIAAKTFDDDTLDSLPLYFEPFILVYNQQAGYHYGPEIAVDEVDTSALLLLEDGHCLKTQTLEICNIKESQLATPFKATSLETLIQMSVTGLGVSIIPKLAVPACGKFGSELTIAEFKDNKQGRKVQLYFRKTSPLVQDFKLLAEIIKSNLPAVVTRH